MSNVINNNANANPILDLFKNAARENEQAGRANDRIVFKFHGDGGPIERRGSTRAYWSWKETKQDSIDQFRNALIKEYGYLAVVSGTEQIDELKSQGKSLRSADITRALRDVKAKFDQLNEGGTKAELYVSKAKLAMVDGTSFRAIDAAKKRVTNFFSENYVGVNKDRLIEKALNNFKDFVAKETIKPSLLNDGMISGEKITALIEKNMDKVESFAKTVAEEHRKSQKSMAYDVLQGLAKEHNLDIPKDSSYVKYGEFRPVKISPEELFGVSRVYTNILKMHEGDGGAFENSLLNALNSTEMTKILQESPDALNLLKLYSNMRQATDNILKGVFSELAKAIQGENAESVSNKLDAKKLCNSIIYLINDISKAANENIPTKDEIFKKFENIAQSFINGKVDLYNAIPKATGMNNAPLNKELQTWLMQEVFENTTLADSTLLHIATAMMNGINSEAVISAMKTKDADSITTELLSIGRAMEQNGSVALETKKIRELGSDDMDTIYLICKRIFQYEAIEGLNVLKEGNEIAGLVSDQIEERANELNSKKLDVMEKMATGEEVSPDELVQLNIQVSAVDKARLMIRDLLPDRY